MRQLVQDLKTGAVDFIEVARPGTSANEILVRTTASLISSGTERMLLDFGKAGWIGKAMSQPDKLRATIEKFKTDGIVATAKAVKAKLDQPLPLGYCNVGEVIESRFAEFPAGCRVVSNGKHAEMVAVATTLSALVPENVTDEDATFAVLGAISLESIRLASPNIGETVAVIGLGVIGLLTVKLLVANGCKVIALDIDESRAEVARRYGAEALSIRDTAQAAAAAIGLNAGRGLDAVIIAAATDSAEPVSLAARMSRKRGRIVLLGVAGLELVRSEFYEKELSFQVSCSYGPGRYDRDYEVKGRDYPFGYVRWTAQRNMEAFLDLLSRNRVTVADLVSHRIPFDKAGSAYEILGGTEPSLGIVLLYPARVKEANATVRLSPAAAVATGAPKVGALGAGNYASAILLPAFARAGARLGTVVSAKGLSGSIVGKRLGFEAAATDPGSVLNDAGTQAVVIATNHDTHAGFVVQALEHGQHVFVEKPLAVSLEQLASIESCVTGLTAGRPFVCVGFNRRFAPLMVRMKAVLDRIAQPKMMTYTVNAGAIPTDHWIFDEQRGGGRLVGEGCHFIDALRFLAGSRITRSVLVKMTGSTKGHEPDTFSIALEFADGSVGNIHYASCGHRGVPKERVEIFSGGAVLQMMNFRSLQGWGAPGLTRQRTWGQDKGQQALVNAFVSALRSGGPEPIPLEESIEVTRVSLELKEQFSVSS